MKKRPLFLLLMISVPVLANSGIPAIAITLPLMILALIPVAFLETAVVHRMVRDGFWRTFRAVLGANAFTTVIGLPLSNVVSYLLSFGGAFLLKLFPHQAVESHRTLIKATFFHYWYDNVHVTTDASGNIIRPYPQEPYWYFILAGCTALFVHLLVSWYLEYWYIQRKLASPKPLLRKAALLANAASYGFLAAGVIVLGLSRR